jgi:hypothetical protein
MEPMDAMELARTPEPESEGSGRPPRVPRTSIGAPGVPPEGIPDLDIPFFEHDLDPRIARALERAGLHTVRELVEDDRRIAAMRLSNAQHRELRRWLKAFFRRAEADGP